MTDDERREAAQNVAMLVFVCLILGCAFLVGAFFGAAFGVAAFFLLTACWMLFTLCVYAKSRKEADDDRD